jgi:hypothetical protein
MIGQITPLVKVAGLRTWTLAVFAHLIGALLSAALLGYFLGLLGMLAVPQPVRARGLLLGGLVCLICAALEFGPGRPYLPTMRRQTPQWFRDEFGAIWGAFAWGVDLGQGWTTWIQSAGYYALLAWSLLLADPQRGAVLFAAFGLGRAAPVVAKGLTMTGRDLSRVSYISPVTEQVLKLASASALAFVGGWAISL